MRRTCVLALMLAFAAGQAQATEIFEKVGTIGGQFLKIGIGARATAMGEAYTSIADDATAVFWNPAGVARLSGNIVSFSHAAWPAELDLNQGAYIFSVGFIPGMMAVHARALSMDPILRTDTTHPEGDGTFFDAGDFAIGFTYGRSFTDKFSAGVGVNYVQETLADYDASTATFDFGVLYDTGYRSLRIGMAIANIGSEMEFIEDTVKMPIVFRLGSSIKVVESGPHAALAAVEFSHPPDNAERGNLGSEYSFKDFLFIRGGYKFNYDSEGLTAGAGVKFPASSAATAKLDYSWSDFETLGGVHRFSAELSF
ncbi:MAG TPA: PorV/PorQ family protein [Candidatus Udaeobacter sp.]|nr:PorV/PorQ family protein [Candidatus Udaeobacter sp.]